MSKREQKMAEKKRNPKPIGPITRRQQVEALRQQKSLEIADRVAGNIREAVKQEVETQLKVIKDTMFDLIDRVVQLEGDNCDRQKRKEATKVSGDDEVVPEQDFFDEDPCDCDGQPNDARG